LQILQIIRAQNRAVAPSGPPNPPNPPMFPPMFPTDPGPHPPDRPSASDLPQLRRADGGAWLVLLADDNAVNREVGTAMLQLLGLQVHTAEDGDDALQMLTGTAYDLVLMDLQMPRLDGFATTRSLRALPGRHALPVIAVTANNSPQSRQDCIAAGMDGFVTKPIDILLLAVALQRCLPATG